MTNGLAPRNREILRSVVQAYIETGEPVASQAVVRRSKVTWSPATIRNVMAELDEQGLLQQPHTSAGRVPTRQAYEIYVQSLEHTRVQSSEVRRLQTEFAGDMTTEARVERISRVLTTLTSNIGIAAAIPLSEELLQQVELIALSEQRVLFVLVGANKSPRNQVIQLERPITQDALVEIRNYLNAEFTGWKLSAVRLELERRLREERSTYNDLLIRLRELYERGMLAVSSEPEVHLEGTATLMGDEVHLTRSALRELFSTLEQKQRILQILDRFLEPPSGAVEIRVGLETLHPSMEELSLIGISLPMPGGLATRVAVLGPLRMQYPRVISAVAHVAHALRSLPQE
jgi:heat-inducible transcriptional repressor